MEGFLGEIRRSERQTKEERRKEKEKTSLLGRALVY